MDSLFCVRGQTTSQHQLPPVTGGTASTSISSRIGLGHHLGLTGGGAKKSSRMQGRLTMGEPKKKRHEPKTKLDSASSTSNPSSLLSFMATGSGFGFAAKQA